MLSPPNRALVHHTAQVLTDRPGVLNLHLATNVEMEDVKRGAGLPGEGNDQIPKMTMLFKISAGPFREENYGLHLARAIGFPCNFLTLAESVSNALRNRREASKQQSQARRLAARRRLVLSLHETLQQASESYMEQDIDEGVSAGYLHEVMAEFILRMEEIESVGRGAQADKQSDVSLKDTSEKASTPTRVSESIRSSQGPEGGLGDVVHQDHGPISAGNCSSPRSRSSDLIVLGSRQTGNAEN